MHSDRNTRDKNNKVALREEDYNGTSKKIERKRTRCQDLMKIVFFFKKWLFVGVTVSG